MIIIKVLLFLHLQSLLLVDFLNKWISGQSEPGSVTGQSGDVIITIFNSNQFFCHKIQK